jgi:hypothetical protein
MAGWKKPGPVCQVANWTNVCDGTQAVTCTPRPGTVQAETDTPSHPLAGVTGKINGVGVDIVAYLRAVGEFFGVNIDVTSGKRDANAQAQAMLENWIKLKRGAVYSTASLSVRNRQAMDNYYKMAMESDKASDADQALAKKKFLEIGRTVRSRHMSGRAVDITTNSLTKDARQALLMRLKAVKEGNRKDILHLESASPVPVVDAAMKARWQAILEPHGRHAALETPALSEGEDLEQCVA